MLKFSIISLFYVFYVIVSQANYTTFDYCTITQPDCVKDADPNHGGHPGCNCTSLPLRAESQAMNLDVIIAFRQKMLDLHNYYRNLVASRQSMLPGAADMMVLNWDSELEHLARCRALNSFGTNLTVLFESCHYDRNSKPYGQNMFTTQLYVIDLDMISTIFMNQWYGQIDYITEAIIDNFQPTEYRYVTQILWSRTTHVGCVRVFNVEYPYPGWKMVVICDYKSVISRSPGNSQGWPVYKKGKACSACFNDTKCETKEYPALCGKLQPVPRNNVTVLGDDLEQIGKYKNSASAGNMESGLFFAASISFLFKVKI